MMLSAAHYQQDDFFLSVIVTSSSAYTITCAAFCMNMEKCVGISNDSRSHSCLLLATSCNSSAHSNNTKDEVVGNVLIQPPETILLEYGK